jgi:hypothetical protein
VQSLAVKRHQALQLAASQPPTVDQLLLTPNWGYLMASERLIFVFAMTALFSAVLSVFAISAAKLPHDRMSSQTALRLLTVVVIGFSALILRVLELISADAAVSALTGIAGFVLGGISGGDQKHGGEAKNAN